MPSPLTESTASLLGRLENAVRTQVEVRLIETGDGNVSCEVMGGDYGLRIGRGASLEEAIAKALEEKS